MNQVFDQLEGRVSAVAALVKNLRETVARLERELASRPVALPPPPGSDATGAACPSPAALEALREEIALLRAERQVVRERIRGLIREIDQVSW